MALRTRTWSDFLKVTQARYGSSLGNHYEAVSAIANQAARQLYDETVYWPRFLVIGEPRTVERNYIQTSEDSFNVYGAGTSAVNGLFQRNGTANSKPRYSKYQSDGTSVDWDLEYDGSANWEILVGADNDTYTEDDVYYSVASTADLPPVEGWGVDDGTAPSPLLVDVADIDTVIRVHKSEPYKNGNSSTEYLSVTESGGIRGIDYSSGSNIAYVTYKKVLDETYGDGTSGSTTSIPYEFFDYMVIYTARSLQAIDRQSNPNPYSTGIAISDVDRAMYGALERVDKQNIFDTLGKRVMTHMNTSTEL